LNRQTSDRSKFPLSALAGWTQGLSKALVSPDPENVMGHLAEGLASLVPSVHIYFGFFRRNSIPILCTPDRIDWDENYLTGAYLLDPLYEQFLKRDASIVLAPKDMYPADFHAQDFYRRLYEPYGWRDKISFLGYIRPDIAGFVTWARRIDEPPFTTAEHKVLRTVLSGIDIAIARLWECSGYGATAPEVDSQRLHRVLQTTYESFGSGILSSREQEVTRRMLKGLAPKEIGKLLRISPGTVRNHVKHIYLKLNVRSQAALLALFFAKLEVAATLAVTPQVSPCPIWDIPMKAVRA
jgi:DNA-binding CsgD family transcriptional regulator